MSGRIRYTDEFKREAVAQVTDRGHSVTSVANRIEVSGKSLYDRVSVYGGTPDKSTTDAPEIRQLKAKLHFANTLKFLVHPTGFEPLVSAFRW